MTAEGNTPNRFILSLPVCDRAAWDSFHREKCMIYDQQRSNVHTSLWLTCCHRVSCHVTSVGPHVCPHASLLIPPGHLLFLPQPSRLPTQSFASISPLHLFVPSPRSLFCLTIFLSLPPYLPHPSLSRWVTYWCEEMLPASTAAKIDSVTVFFILLWEEWKDE